MTNPLAASSLPEEAYNLAAQYGLGTPQAQYQRSLSRRRLIVEAVIAFAGIVLLIFSIIFISIINHLSSGSVGWTAVWQIATDVRMLLMISGLGLLIRDLIYHPHHVLVCTGGLIWRRSKKQRVVRWEEVESVSLRDGTTGAEPICTVRRTDGAKLICWMDRSQLKALGEAVAHAAEPYLLPRAWETYRSGAPVRFGKLIRIGQDGIHHKRKFLPWSQYCGYLMDESVLIISMRDGEFWTDVPLHRIPNLHVLTGLLDKIRQGQAQGIA